jgi:hypothetical protein
MIPGAASAARGIVAWVGPGCDYFVAETPMGYAVLEWYGGARPRKGDLVVGAFEKFGFTDIYYARRDTQTHVRVDDYSLSADSAAERVADHCR